MVSPPPSAVACPVDDVRSPADLQAAKLAEYHRYLESNYAHGVHRFFSPTGFLRKFEHTVSVVAEKKREAVYVRDMDDAAGKLQKVVSGGEGVYDLIAEPGTGKTTVLPFRFPGSRVVVALPTPFEAWSAFNTAAGEASLKLKGLTLGKKDARVCYMDSYLAANMVLSGYMQYDVLIVDECDSGKGVTGFLADVRAPGKVLVRMSASHGRTGTGSSRSFNVVTQSDMPDVRNGVDAVVEYVSVNAKGRSLLLAPDAVTAGKLSGLLPGSRLVSSEVSLGELARHVLEQRDDGLVVSDDVCARGLNLNLDMVFDCQLVDEHGVVRHANDAEMYQRKGRVGRNKPGWYFSPGLSACEKLESDADIVRSNVVRVAACVEQSGPGRAHVTVDQAERLLHSDDEPYVMVVKEAQAIVEPGFSASPEPPGSPDSVAVQSVSSSDDDRVVEVPLPQWMMWGTKMTGKSCENTTVRVTRDSRGRRCIERRKSSGSSDAVSLRDLPSQLVKRPGALAPVRPAAGKHAEGAPYAVAPVRGSAAQGGRFPTAVAPPVMDLSASAYEFEWPALLADLADRCGDLPTIVPPGSWQHTALGGMGSNWLERLEVVALGNHSFLADEFEVVCRAWNLMVASTWVRRSPGLSAGLHVNRMEFCMRYFQMYYQIASAG